MDFGKNADLVAEEAARSALSISNRSKLLLEDFDVDADGGAGPGPLSAHTVSS